MALREIKHVEFKAGLPLEIEVLPIAATISRQKAAMSTPHRAAFYHIFWVQHGEAVYVIDFEPVRVQANTLLFVNKDRVNAFDSESAHDGKILIFTDNFFARNEEDIRYLHSTLLFNDPLDTTAIHVTNQSALPGIFMEIANELENLSDVYQADIVHGLLRTLLTLSERERGKQHIPRQVERMDLDYTLQFKNLIENRFESLKSVRGYAVQLNISEKRLTAATKKATGKSPKMLIDERVVLEAKRLLVHTALSIKEIAYRLGFSDPPYFIKFFRKHGQKTPIEFRDSFFTR